MSSGDISFPNERFECALAIAILVLIAVPCVCR